MDKTFRLPAIMWAGHNLKEVLEFTGKADKFDQWFKTFEEYKAYVRSHSNIFKLFRDDGSHYECAVGTWIVMNPFGYCYPLGARLVPPKAVKPSVDGEVIEVPDNNYSINEHTHLEVSVNEQDLKDMGYKKGDKVKVVFLNE